MKKIITLLVFGLLASACSKEEIVLGELSFSAAYVNDDCMNASPAIVIISFDETTVRIPVKEINTGVISTVPVVMPKGKYRLTDIRVLDTDGNVTSYFETEFHESGWVVTPIVDNWFVDVTGTTTVRGQLFCENFWNNL